MSDKDTELYERVAKIEGVLDGHVASDEARFTAMSEIKEILSRQDQRLDDIDKDLARYEGRVGGVLLAFTAIFAFLKFAWDDVVAFFK